ncbi:MAG: hypothetical protein ABIW84_08655, partial [Ilumatobacteraceae bacterium]
MARARRRRVRDPHLRRLVQPPAAARRDHRRRPGQPHVDEEPADGRGFATGGVSLEGEPGHERLGCVSVVAGEESSASLASGERVDAVVVDDEESVL